MLYSYQNYLNTTKFAGLDGLRCMAIVPVIWHHTAMSGPLPMLHRGFLGVDLFFVLSGFLITTLLLRERAKTGAISLYKFWVRRFLRLMPAYYGLLIVLALAYLIFRPNDQDTQLFINGLPIYGLYLSNWFQPGANNLDPLWSLATEEQFYLVWPVLEVMFVPVFLLIVGLLFLVLNQLVNFGILDGAILTIFGIHPEQHPEILDTTFTPILLGVALAHGLNRKITFRYLARFLGGPLSALITGVLLLVLINVPVTDLSGGLRLAIHLAMTGLIGAILLSPDGRLSRQLSLKPVAFIGAISYGMYLYHMWAVHFLNAVFNKIGLTGQPILLFILVFIMTVMVATVSYYLYEKRFLDLRKRFRTAG